MSQDHAIVFYDGRCGLCHAAVRFALGHDTDGSRFRFAPLQGVTLRERLSADLIAGLSDSLVMLTTGDEILQQSDAVLRLLAQIGGGWATLGEIIGFVPRPVRDCVYRSIARVRHRLCRRPPALCPLVPAALHDRFLP